VLSITIVSDTPNCGVTYDRHYDVRNSFIIQATGFYETNKQRCIISLIINCFIIFKRERKMLADGKGQGTLTEGESLVQLTSKLR